MKSSVIAAVGALRPTPRLRMPSVSAAVVGTLRSTHGLRAPTSTVPCPLQSHGTHGTMVGALGPTPGLRAPSVSAAVDAFRRTAGLRVPTSVPSGLHSHGTHGTMVGALGPTPGLRAPTTSVAGRVPLGALLPPVVGGLVPWCYGWRPPTDPRSEDTDYLTVVQTHANISPLGPMVPWLAP
jgi:hypothetical protein